eukprot:6206456-Pleurochrysis_carterae.AAC.2
MFLFGRTFLTSGYPAAVQANNSVYSCREHENAKFQRNLPFGVKCIRPNRGARLQTSFLQSSTYYSARLASFAGWHGS